MSYLDNCYIPPVEYEKHLEERVLVTEAQPQSVYSFMVSLDERLAAKSPSRLEENFVLDQDTGLYVAKMAFLDFDFRIVYAGLTSFSPESFFDNRSNLAIDRFKVLTGYLLDYGTGLDADKLKVPERAVLVAPALAIK